MSIIDCIKCPKEKKCYTCEHIDKGMIAEIIEGPVEKHDIGEGHYEYLAANGENIYYRELRDFSNDVFEITDDDIPF